MDQEPTQLPIAPSVDDPTPDCVIVINFGPNPRDVRIQVTNGTPFQMWGAARMLEQYAQDAWNNAQMQQAMQQARAAVDAGPQDHKKRKGN